MSRHVAATCAVASSLAMLGACTASASYLGAQAPESCSAKWLGRCAGWLAERQLDAGELDVYDDPGLRDYVQGIADRLAAGSELRRGVRVVISDHDGTYTPFGDRVVIGRQTLERLGSEAEVAAVVAHEMVHVEGHHATISLFGKEPDDRWFEDRRDAEGIADERAVALLERAGYTPAAMPRALAAELESDDPEHPPREDRIARTAALVNHRTAGFDGRNELLRHENHMVVGRDTRLGDRIGASWVIASLDVALDLSDDDLVHVDGDTLELHHDRDSLTLYPIGGPWARELASHLGARAEKDTAIGHITIGVAGEEAAEAGAAGEATGAGMSAADNLARLEQVVRATLPRPPAGTWVLVLDRCTADPNAPCGGLVIEIAVHGSRGSLDHWLSQLRPASDREQLAAEPAHLLLMEAARAGKVAELIAGCPDPAAALALDNPERMIEAGAAVKCTDRRITPPDAAAVPLPTDSDR